MNTQITIDEILEVYQKEIASLMHNKLISNIQINKLTEYVNQLEKENSELKEQFKKNT